MKEHSRAPFFISLFVCLMVPVVLLLMFGMYVTIGDGVYAGLILKGVFAPPNPEFYTVTNGSNRFLLKPLIWLYAKWDDINWFDLTQIIPGILVLFALLTITLKTLKDSLQSTQALVVASILTSLLGAIFVENLILYDPLSSTLMLPFLVMATLKMTRSVKVKIALSVVVVIALVYAWQIRYHGVFVGFVVSSGLFFILTENPLHFFKQRALPIILIIFSFGIFYAGSVWQDSYLTDEDKKVELMDKYMYTMADAHIINTDKVNMSDPADSIKFIAYYSFYFPENVENSLAYLDDITYQSGMGFSILNNLPVKWRTFWEEAQLYTDFDTYHNYDRFMYYMLAFNILFLMFFMFLVPNKTWLLRAFLWSLFAWGFFIGIGVAVKMIYKLATPLVFFFMFSFIWFIIEALKRESDIKLYSLWTGFALVTTLTIVIVQLSIYHIISTERQAGLELKSSIVDEMNTHFSDKLLIFDLFSMPLLENEIGGENIQGKLIPKTTMYGDFYMSHFPRNIKHLEGLSGGNTEFVPFFSHWANNPEDVVLVMSKYRIDLIKGYLKFAKGIDIEITPLPGDHKIEELEYSFYEVPLELNYYQINWTDNSKTDIL